MVRISDYFRRLMPHAGIGTKITFLICATALLASGTIGLVTYWYFDDALVRREFADLDGLARSKGDRFVAEVAELSADAQFLSRVAVVQEWVRERSSRSPDHTDSQVDAKLRERLTTTFKSLLNAKPRYLQVLFIALEGNGTEIARAYRDQGNIRSELEQSFQGKSNEAYFDPAIHAPPGQVYLSPINLNREDCRVTLPSTPVMRAAVTVRDEQGTVLDFVIINRFMGPLFDSLSQDLAYKQTLILANEQGECLANPDPGKKLSLLILGILRAFKLSFPALRTPLPRRAQKKPRCSTVLAAVATPSSFCIKPISTSPTPNDS